MADKNSTHQAAVVLSTTTRNYSPSLAPIQATQRVARFLWTADANHADGDKITLGALGLSGCRVIPELCRIRGTGSGTTAVKFTLQKTDSAGANAVALSAQTSQVTSAVATTTLAIPTAGGAPVELAETDLLKLVLNYGTGATLTLAATNTYTVEIGYTVDDPA